MWEGADLLCATPCSCIIIMPPPPPALHRYDGLNVQDAGSSAVLHLCVLLENHANAVQVCVLCVCACVCLCACVHE